jgi:hypothetical protein
VSDCIKAHSIFSSLCPLLNTTANDSPIGEPFDVRETGAGRCMGHGRSLGKTKPVDTSSSPTSSFGKCSRLLVALTINRDPYFQINHGTGKDVSAESIADAKEPLIVQWLR